jgi:hypothetical protein
MEIEYDLRLEDIEAFARFQLKHGPKLKPRLFVQLIGLALAVAIVGLGLLAGLLSEQPNTLWMSGFCGGAIAGILTTFILLAFLQKKLVVQQTSRLYNTEESRWHLAWRRLKITVDGFETTNDVEQLRYNWCVLSVIDSTDNHAFFYTALHQAHIIPRRAFRDRQHFEEFIDLACRYHKGLAPRELTEILDALPAEQTGITRSRHS